VNPDDPHSPAGQQAGQSAADAQSGGDVDQICENCPDNWVEAGAIDESTGQPIPGLGYRIYDLASGDRMAQGVLDDEGESPRHPIPQPITQLYVVYGTQEAMDEAEDQIEEVRRQRALEANARPDWNGIPAGLDEENFNHAYDMRARELGSLPPRNAGLLDQSASGWKAAWDYVTSGFDGDATLQEFYQDERARSFDEYELVTGGREASRWESFGGGAGQGVTFGFGDEAMAGLDAMLSNHTYEEAVAARRQIIKAQRIANPGTFIGGEITGAVPTIFIPVGGAAGRAAQAGKGVTGAVRAGATTGAATGALSGAGHDTGGILDRLDGAALGGATGGTAGALLGGAGVMVARGVTKTRIWGRLRGRVPPRREPYHRSTLRDEWYDPDTGDLRWPPNDGFDAPPTRETLAPGTRIDRYSGRTGIDDTGRYLSPEGANFGSRALPYDPSTQQYAVYEVVRDLPVSSGRAAAWFDEVGGATQYMLDDSVADLINQGFIRQVSP